MYKTYADLRAETERTYLGFLWWVFEPIMYMFVFYVVFAVFMGRKTDNFVPFLLIGLTIWQWMQACLAHGSESILGYRGLMQSVHLPKVIFPIILILTDSTKFIFIFTILLLYLWISGFTIGLPYLALPLVLLVELIFIMAVTFFLAAIVPFLPDIRFVVDKVLQAVFFASGIFFASESIPEQYQIYYYLNPMATIIESSRDILMYNQWPNWQLLFIIGFVSSIGLFLSIRLIAHFEYTYPKVTM
ncbi:MAG: ABC transporter permease [Thiotrichaceae bacterium]|nr:ABC transporter permease [Thiotrichaceae bacterium]